MPTVSNELHAANSLALAHATMILGMKTKSTEEGIGEWKILCGSWEAKSLREMLKVACTKHGLLLVFDFSLSSMIYAMAARYDCTRIFLCSKSTI